MSQILTLQPGAPSQRPTVRPTVWGLGARRLHDAYWRSWGVQCVRRGEVEELLRSAELFLLVEPGQMVVFDLPKLIDRLVWHKASVTRVRVIDQDDEQYGERVVVDANGLVERIERRYRPRTRASYRVLLTSSRRVATRWMTAANRREGWDAARRAVAWSRVDHARTPGGCFMEGHADDERALIRRLVSCWPDPGQVLDGVELASPGIWKAKGDPVANGAVLIRPLWVDYGGVVDEDACLVGPNWTADQATVRIDATRVRIREISEIELNEVHRSPETSSEPEPGYAVAKRTFDIVFSLGVLVLMLPIFLLIGLCIMLQDGRPVFYGHVRQARGGKTFKCWKFRTMYRNREKLTDDLAAKNTCDGPQVFIRNDPRVSSVGKVLRRFQLDEFPQFWNVLLGEMSIVGPRPSPDEENQFCPAWRDLRLSVRPGITGLWQLNRTRASGEDFQEWIRYDVEYVRRASFWLDMKICVRTGWVLLVGGRETCA